MQRRLRHTLALLALVALSGATSAGAAAAGPTLWLPCSLPVKALVACRLSGKGFYARERVAITYRVAVSTRRNGQRVTVYHRTARTNAAGVFASPALRFAVEPRMGSYVVRVTAVGAHGDSVTDDFIAIAQ
ncbi:MAG: hypothetical protein NVSMB65_03740 [Chloroflexota bacterium]